ncbi:hypothetical protein [Kribbella sp.]|uniref:hypothetical protein n=1 Tax=Kribbella sp. TaxID=1871183 RepID=UPI002D608B36|nr:hypothetical protein [Kribbella sp.]HZX01434.1 hypothetical protein [Kribbella sp.]
MFEKRAVRKATEQLNAADRRQRDTEDNGRATRAAFHGTAAGRDAVKSSVRADKDAKKEVKRAEKKLGAAERRLAQKNERKGRTR